MRNLAVNVMEHVSLRNTVRCGSTNPAHEATEVAKKVAVQRSQCTTREGEFTGAIMGQERVGVLEERNQDEPVVNPNQRQQFSVLSRPTTTWEGDIPKIRRQVNAENIDKPERSDRGSYSEHPEYDTEIGEEDLAEMMRSEQVLGARVEV